MEKTEIRFNQEDILRIIRESVARTSDYSVIPDSSVITGRPGKDLCVICTMEDDAKPSASAKPAFTETPANWQETENLIIDLDQLIMEVNHS